MCFMFCDEDAGDNLSDMYFEHIHEVCPTDIRSNPDAGSSVNYASQLTLNVEEEYLQ